MKSIFNLLLLATIMSISSKAADVVVFGDSWGVEGASAFQKNMESHGLTVTNKAVGGTTAKEFSKTPNCIKDVINSSASDGKIPKYVWLTIGGNDALQTMVSGPDITQLLKTTKKNTEIILKPLFDAYPDIKVVQFGYEILNWKQNILCEFQGNEIFSHYCNPALNVTCNNNIFFRLQHEFVDALSKDYKQHTGIDLLGTLQKAGGVKGADIGKPVINQPSPVKYLEDCIHPNNEGFGYIFDALWDVYFKHQEKQANS